MNGNNISIKVYKVPIVIHDKFPIFLKGQGHTYSDHFNTEVGEQHLRAQCIRKVENALRDRV